MPVMCVKSGPIQLTPEKRDGKQQQQLEKEEEEENHPWPIQMDRRDLSVCGHYGIMRLRDLYDRLHFTFGNACVGTVAGPKSPDYPFSLISFEARSRSGQANESHRSDGTAAALSNSSRPDQSSPFFWLARCCSCYCYYSFSHRSMASTKRNIPTDDKRKKKKEKTTKAS